ncbi:hypothetical protein CEXT_790231 [Caerostris extrusa]|uniref:Uncharacterized protein n=1 Tax=Caerostris extrusa TaxID=172846 RepID=A0AAV4TIT6_CAEEX|nr:hypothetical protein CEXT_790231 [Caerostris extrusa]
MASPSSSLPDSSSLFGSPTLVDSILDEFQSFNNHNIEENPCLESIQDNHEKLKCPKCEQDCILPPQGIAGLISDYATMNVLESNAVERTPFLVLDVRQKRLML